MLDQEPSAIVTVNGSEKKIYQNGQIFLNNGENFEIRFFNPLQEKIGIEIIFNGQKKNDGLLVLNPGQDITLDRFLGENKKMRYETYTIDSNNSAAVQAAALNGLVEFKFYKEKINNSNTWTGVYNNYFCCRVITSPSYTGSPPTYSTNTTYSSSDSDFNSYATLDSVKSVETGRVEKGPESNQNLSTVDVNFEIFPFHTISYQLKPNSQLSDLKEIRQYCTGCGYRLRKQNWRYCPSCGTKND